MDIKRKIHRHNVAEKIKYSKECYNLFIDFVKDLHSFRINDDTDYIHPIVYSYINIKTNCMNPKGYNYVTINTLDNYDKELKEKFIEVVNYIRRGEDNMRDIFGTILDKVNAFSVKIRTDNYGDYEDNDSYYINDLPRAVTTGMQEVINQRDYKQSTRHKISKNYDKFYLKISNMRLSNMWRVKKLLLSCLNAVDENYWSYESLRFQDESSLKGYNDRKYNRKFVGKQLNIKVSSYTIDKLQKWCSHSLFENIYSNSTNEYAEMLKQYNNYVIPSIDDDRNFTITNDGIMTFTPAGKKTMVNSEGTHWLNHKKDIANRMPIKIHKGIRKMFKHINLSDAWIEAIGNHVKAMYTFSGSFKVVTGGLIRKYYSEGTYDHTQSTGSLSSSCMKHDSCQDFFDMYVNTKDVSMLVAFANEESDKIIGRALLWNKVYNNHDGSYIKCMDRVYGTQVTINAFKRWGTNNGYYVKTEQTYDHSQFTSPTGMIVDQLEVEVKNVGRQVPYMDTFRFTDDYGCDDMTLSTYRGSDTLDSTSGGNEDYVECVDGSRYHEDDCRYVEYGESEHGWYHSDDCVYVEDGYDMHYEDAVEIDGYYYNPDGANVVWSDRDGQHYLKDDCTYLDCGDYVLSDEAVLCEIDQIYIHENDSVEHHGHTVNAEFSEEDVIEHFNIEIDE